MGIPRKYPLKIVTRDPATDNRDPMTTARDPVIAQVTEERERVVQQRSLRRYIPASMPTLCPDCGGNTRMANGRHVDPVRSTVLEYRTCAHCGAKLAAGRGMTEREKGELCKHVEAVKEYENALKP